MRYGLFLFVCLSGAVPARAADMPVAVLSLSGDGEAAGLSGPIGPGSGAAFEALVAGAPQLRLLRLESPGGMVEEARTISAAVDRLGLDTYVARACASACTQIFYAGRHRWLRQGARLGFHGYGTAEGHTATAEQIGAAQDLERRSYARGGLPGWFVDRIFSTPNKDIWVPSANEMLAARFATDVTTDENPLDHEVTVPGMPRVNHPMAGAGSTLPRVIGP